MNQLGDDAIDQLCDDLWAADDAGCIAIENRPAMRSIVRQWLDCNIGAALRWYLTEPRGGRERKASSHEALIDQVERLTKERDDLREAIARCARAGCPTAASEDPQSEALRRRPDQESR